jgi:glycosyltransferase involved in cell wall biosynthesis
MAQGKGPNILICSSYDVGGASIAAIRLHIGLLEIGANSKFLCLHKSNHQIPESYAFQAHAGWPEKIKLKFRQRSEHKQRVSLQISEDESLSGKFSFPTAPYDVTQSPLWEWADVVHLHWVNEWISVENLVSSSKYKPLIWTMHDFHAFTGGCHYAGSCENFKHDCQPCGLLSRTNMPQLAHHFWNMKNAALKFYKPRLTITAPSEWMRQKAASGSLFRDFPSKTIPNGLDTGIFTPADRDACRKALNLPGNKIILLSVIQSLKDERKGFDLLLQAMNLLPDPESWLLCTVGKQLEKSEASPVQHIHLGTLVDERLMAIVYNAADIFVHPAREDNLPNVVVESIACGIPVAGFEIGGMPEMITNQENGFLSEEVSAPGLAEVIIKTNLHPWKRQEIAAYAEKKFSRIVQANAFMALYRELAS